MFKRDDRFSTQNHVDNQEFVVVDIETTGLSRYTSKITEIGALKIRNNKIIDRFETLVDPEQRIPRFITKITGITNDMVKNASKVYEVLPRFLNFLGERCFIGHYATFDYNFLNHNAQLHHDHTMLNDKLCTCRLARRLLPELPSKRLSCVSNHLGISETTEHRAMSDALITAKIFVNFLNKLKEKGVNSVDELVKFQGSKIPKLY